MGPARRELDRGLQVVGIERDDVDITNLVKHFEFRAKGHKRLHESPDREEMTMVVGQGPFLTGVTPLDVTFDDDGAMYVADFTGTVLRVDRLVG